jgi:hypothetical protein
MVVELRRARSRPYSPTALPSQGITLASMADRRVIRVQGARQNNLKSISVRIPVGT